MVRSLVFGSGLVCLSRALLEEGEYTVGRGQRWLVEECDNVESFVLHYR